MSRTRDIIREIADVRQRRRFGSAMSDLPVRLFALEQVFEEYDKSQSELTRYFPVALIACVEGYFRMAIKDLVDSGDPYLSNAGKPASSLKIDFSILRAVHGKAITVGELVAHGIPLSRLDYIDVALTNLIGKGFLEALRTTTDRWAHEVKGEEASPILMNPDRVFSDVARTFELRHIICHEIASAYEIEADEVARCFQSCVAFLRTADEFISETLHPGAPMTQTDMNIAAGESLSKTRCRLEDESEKVKQHLNTTELAAFNEAQSKWEAYSKAWVAFVAGERSSSGTIWPLIAAEVAEATVNRRIEEITCWRRLGDGL